MTDDVFTQGNAVQSRVWTVGRAAFRLTSLLMKLTNTSRLPLKGVESGFAIDSTGFMSTRLVRWFNENTASFAKITRESNGTLSAARKTNVIAAVEILDRSANDSPVLPALVENAVENVTMREVSADMAIASITNFDSIVAARADPFIPFKSSATGGVGGLYAKAFHFLALYRQALVIRTSNDQTLDPAFR